MAEGGSPEPASTRLTRPGNSPRQRRDELAALNENLRRASYVADMNLARVAWDENNLSRAHELLEKHRPQPGETDLRGFEWHYLRRLFHRDLLTVKAHARHGHGPSPSRRMASGWSSGSASHGGRVRPRSGDVKFWDAATGQPLRVRSVAAPRTWKERPSAPMAPISPRPVGIIRSWSGTWPQAGSSRWKGLQSDRPRYAIQSRRQAIGLHVWSR